MGFYEEKEVVCVIENGIVYVSMAQCMCQFL